MQTLEGLHHRIDNAADMQTVVAAMKVLAMVSIRQYERALAALADYNRTIELGLKTVLSNRPPGVEVAPSPEAGPVGALVFGSQQGLSGQFNEQIVAFALKRLDELGVGQSQRTLLAVGEQVIHRLGSAGQPVAGSLPLPGSAAGMKRAAAQVFAVIERLRREQGVERLLLFYHQPLSGAHYRPFMLQLYPLDPELLNSLEKQDWPTHKLPSFTMNWQELWSALIRQYFFAAVKRAFVESLLSENASRLLAMQLAEKNIGDYLDDLKRQYNHRRQSEITAELLDIVAGSEALAELGEGEEEYEAYL